jgi:hypothetical protein
MKTLGLFFVALWKYWWALMSCAVFTFIGLYALVRGKSNSWTITAILITAGLLLLWASFLAWKKEHDDLESEKAKQARPNIAGEFKWSDTVPKTLNLYLHNSSESPAVDISIQDVRVGEKVLRFTAPAVLHHGISGPVPCGELYNGYHQTNDVYWIVQDDHSTGTSSSIFSLRVNFSSLDDRAAKKSWRFDAVFWYDKVLQEMIVQNQSITLVK